MRKLLWMGLLMMLPALAQAAISPQDRAVLAAYEAFRHNDRAGVVRQMERVPGHPLEVYVRFWELALRLEETDPETLQGFLRANEGTPLAEELRERWLKLLGKQGQWERFREQRPLLTQADPEIACLSLQEKWTLDKDLSPADLKPFLNAARPLPQACVPLVEAMLQTGLLTPKDLKDRFRLLVAANEMKEALRLLDRLPADERPAAAHLQAALKTPQAFLARPASAWQSPAERELAVCALIRQAQGDPILAVRAWAALPQQLFAPEDRQILWASFAAQGALRHLPEAVQWYREAGEIALSEEKLLWRARIALRQEDWPEVKAAIERLPAATQGEAVWTFWRGRALIALGAREEGLALLKGIAGGHDYYGRLAAEELGLPFKLPPRETPPSNREVEEIGALPGLKRALAFYRIGLKDLMTREWIWAVRPLDDRSLLAAAELAKRHGLWDRAINTADRTIAAHDFSLRYPQHYNDVLSRQARLRRLDEPLVFGLVRQESRFIADAKSPAGALGLMQVLPSTARLIAKQLGLKSFTPARAARPEMNALLGTYYLRQMLDGLDGSPVLATAAYNAGPGRARRWCDSKPLEGAIYVETIPFSETRQYVKKVLVNALYYAALSGGEPRSLKSVLGVVKGALPAGSDPLP